MHQSGAINSTCCEDLQQVVFPSKPAVLYGFYKNREKALDTTALGQNPHIKQQTIDPAQ
jgi:hypothetical protein